MSGDSLEAVRDSTVDALVQHFAGDRLTMADFERRVDRAHRATTRAELDGLLADLPKPERSPAPRVSRSVTAAPRETRSGPPVVVAFMGGNSRGGRWRPGDRVVAVAVMGGVELDFREAIMEGATEIVVLAMMGGVEIIVPPEMVVYTGGLAVMGGVEHKDDRPVDSPTRSLPHGQRPAAPGATAAGEGEPGMETAATQEQEAAPSIRITGLALMGGVEIRTRDRGQRRSDR